LDTWHTCTQANSTYRLVKTLKICNSCQLKLKRTKPCSVTWRRESSQNSNDDVGRMCWRDWMSIRRLRSPISQYQASCVTAPLGLPTCYTTLVN